MRGENMGVYPVSNLKEIRKNKYPSMTDFVEKTDVSRKTMERAESGHKRISENIMKIIAQTLGVKFEEIIDEERSYPKEELRDNENTTKTLKELGIIKYNHIQNRKKKVKVRYMGTSAAVYREDKEVLNTWFFTTDMKSPLYECEINMCLPILESEFNKIVDKLFKSKKYRNAIDLGQFDESKVDKNTVDVLKNKKILSLRCGDEVEICIVDDKHMEIVDFYPKAKIEYINKTYRLIENLAYKIDTTKILSLKDSLIAIGYESIHKIIRSSLLSNDNNIRAYVSENIDDFKQLATYFGEISKVFVDYFNEEINEKEATKKINEVYKKIIPLNYLLIKLDEIYGCIYVKDLHKYAEFMFNNKLI